MVLKRFLKILLILLLTVGVVCSCCSCGTSGNDNTTPTSADDSSIIKDISFDEESFLSMIEEAFKKIRKSNDTYLVCKGYSNFLDETFSSTVITRLEWLKMLTNKLGYDVISDLDSKFEYIVDKDYFDGSEYFITAIENGMLYRGGRNFSNYSPATKQFVATSVVKALDYDIDYKLKCDDYEKIDEKQEAAAAVYLGYFELDEDNRFNPKKPVTQEDVDLVLSQLDLVNTLKGKTVMSFGDSIMHGDGNDYVGIAQLIALKYKMSAVDYSIGGATFAEVEGREQICDQIKAAVKNKNTADFILINGGTNDMRKADVGDISEDFLYKEHGKKDFANGMEYALGLLKDNYPDTPVVYIRAHDMEFSLERNELHFGKIALDICDKWDIEVADIFTDTDFDAHDKDIKNKYTKHSKNCEKGDSVHPNRQGYYEYYIPLTVEKMVKLIKTE